jgi:HK97 family phage major capsid protein
MDKIKELKSRVADLIAKMKTLLDKADEEKRDLTDVETVEYNAADGECDKLKKDIEKREKLLADESRLSEAEPVHRQSVTMKQANRSKEWRALGEFIHSVCFDKDDPRLQDCDYRNIQTRDQSMKTGSEGGFAVPEQFRPTLLQVSPAEAIFEPRATVIPAGDPPDAKITMPALDQTANSNVYGGVVMYKVGEAGSLTKSSIALKEVSLEPAGIGGYVQVTNKLLDNWQAAGPLLEKQLRSALIGYKDTQFYNGNGVAGPQGILTANCTIPVNRSTANQIAAADIRNIYARIKMGGSYVWIASQTILPQLLALADGGSNLIFQTDYTKPIPNSLMGIPLIFHDRSVALGTKGDLVLADPAYYLIKQGSGPYISSDGGIVNFTSNQTLIKIITHIDGKPWLSEALPLEGSTSNTVSPFVVLN